jgi:hypothetical protein
MTFNKRVIILLSGFLMWLNCLAQDSPPAPPGHGLNDNQAPVSNENLLIEFLQVFGDENICYSGYSIISASDVVVFPEGSLLLKAVDAIHIQPPAYFYSGASFRAVISAQPCDEPEQLNEFLFSGSIKGQGKVDLFRVYPNPGNGIFRIEPLAACPDGDAQILVYSLSGGLLHQEMTGFSQSHMLDLSDKQKGVYLLRIITAKETSISKIVIR